MENLRAEPDAAPQVTYSAAPVDDLSADAAARTTVAATSGG